MKKITILTFLVLSLILTSYIFPQRSNNKVKTIESKTSIKKHKKRRNILKVDATYYNPVAGQCDSNPLETASTDVIDLNKLEKKEIRWVACSRNLLKRWGGKLKYGDKITVVSKNKNLSGVWIVKDSMNKRFKNRIDFLCSNRIKGDFTDVVIKF